MLFILAPSKTMDFRPADLHGLMPNVPEFQTQAEKIVTSVRATKDIAPVMHISATLASATRKKYDHWGEKMQPAIFAYVGDVYKGFYARTLTKKDILWAQKHLRIMSGVYGLLRPLDEISEYRLEMKARLPVAGKKDIYDFWDDMLAKKADAETDDGIICVLSSDEYARPVTKFTKSRLITPVFFDNKPNGTVGTVPIYSKMMRGVMGRWVIDARAKTPEDLQKFEAQGYRYDASKSTPDQPAFYREHPAPIEYEKRMATS